MASNAVKEAKFYFDEVGTNFNAVIFGGNGNSVHEEAIRVVKLDVGGDAESFDKGEAEIGGLSCGNEIVEETIVEFCEENVENVERGAIIGEVGSSGVCGNVGVLVKAEAEIGDLRSGNELRVQEIGVEFSEKVERGSIIGEVMVKGSPKKGGGTRNNARKAQYFKGRVYGKTVGEGDASGEVGSRYRVVGPDGNVKVMVDVTHKKQLGRARKSGNGNAQFVNGRVYEEMVGGGDVPWKAEVRENSERARFETDEYGGVNVEKLEASERGSECCQLSDEGKNEGEAKAEEIESFQDKMERARKGDTTHCAARYSFSFQDEKKDGFDFSDVVWCKVKSYMSNSFAYWWPGQIFDPSSASKMVLDMQKDGHLLVACFGDETFAWYGESHLRHSQTYFLQMEKQRGRDSVQDAVHAALEYVSRRVELAMTCSCHNNKVAAHTSIFNQKMKTSGIEEGICFLAGNETWIIDSFNPKQFIGFLCTLAVFPDEGASNLDLTILNSQMNAFHHSKARNTTGSSLLGKRRLVTEDGGRKK